MILRYQLALTDRDYANDSAWEYYRFLGPTAVENADRLLFMESKGGKGEDERFELIIRPEWPTLAVPPNRPDGCYGTNDMFVKHPTIPGAYKTAGRIDDTLVHVTGEKTNPVVSP